MKEFWRNFKEFLGDFERFFEGFLKIFLAILERRNEGFLRDLSPFDQIHDDGTNRNLYRWAWRRRSRCPCDHQAVDYRPKKGSLPVDRSKPYLTVEGNRRDHRSGIDAEVLVLSRAVSLLLLLLLLLRRLLLHRRIRAQDLQHSRRFSSASQRAVAVRRWLNSRLIAGRNTSLSRRNHLMTSWCWPWSNGVN